MKQTYDTDAVLFGILKGSTAITSALSGGVYVGSRPDNSVNEDIVISTIALTQDSEPQLGTSNINVHVPDATVTINGFQQKVENRTRIKLLVDLVLTAVRSARIQGLTIVVENQTTIAEPDTDQHFANIRINWNIH